MKADEPACTVSLTATNAAARVPEYASEAAAGADLFACLEAPITLEPGTRVLVPTGIRIALPPNTEAQIRPRSGLAYRHGVTVANAPGTIDSDYRGEIQVLLVNLGDESYRIEPGDRVAQLVVAPVIRARFAAAAELPESVRGKGGFGSTGT